MAETDYDETFLFGEYRLIDGPSGVKMRQQIRHRFEKNSLRECTRKNPSGSDFEGSKVRKIHAMLYGTTQQVAAISYNSI